MTPHVVLVGNAPPHRSVADLVDGADRVVRFNSERVVGERAPTGIDLGRGHGHARRPVPTVRTGTGAVMIGT